VRRIFLFTLLIIVFCSTVFSMNYITLKDGRVFSGRAVRSGNIITISGAQGLFQFPSSEVKNIDGELEIRKDTRDMLKELLDTDEIREEPIDEIPTEDFSFDELTSDETDVSEDVSPSPDNPIVIMETTKGIIEIEVFQDKAPITSENFISLIEKEYYNGIIFHRVIENFMIQGGCPDGTGRGGPGYTIEDEFHPDLKHDKKGFLSMANAGPNTGGSQFFITLVPTPWLDGKHAIFGRVISGMDVVETIGKVETGDADRPVEPVVMEKVFVKK
jgi:cyclophilin family peptidyl-prolyl cis-trans isomerase